MSPFKNGRDKRLWVALIVSWVLIFVIALSSVVYTSAVLIGVKNQLASYNPQFLQTMQNDIQVIKDRSPQSGKDGAPGTNGVDGSNGANGKNGVNGTNALSTYIEKESTIVQQVPLPGLQGIPGVDGKTIEIGKTTDNQIVWRFSGDRSWQAPDDTGITYQEAIQN